MLVGLGLVGVVLLLGTIGRSDQDTVLTDLEEAAVVTENDPVAVTTAESIAVPSPDAENDFPAVTTDAIRDSGTVGAPVPLGFTIVETLPHDTGAFTQGLEIDNGRLFESTGLVGRSSIREIDLGTGEIIRQQAVPDVFAEGLTLLDDSAIQLTWQDGVAYRYNTDTFEVTNTYSYEGEGWGLCDFGAELVMSDGTPTLDFRDSTTFELLSSVDVTLSGAPVSMLNELECVDGTVWANIWQSSLIVQIDPATGDVIGVLNAATLTPPSVADDNSAVLNGIAYDPADGTFLLTGKLWPSIFRVRIDAQAQ